MTLRAQVFSSLHNAFDNGFDFRKVDPAAVVVDLLEFDGELEDIEPAEILPFVVEWQAEQRK